MIPKTEEIKNNLNALKKFNFKKISNISYINVEKVLKLPKNPTEKNSPN